MNKLYKRIKRVLHYHEAWVHGASIIEHWGIVGERGETTKHKRNKKVSGEKQLQEVLAKPLATGYKSFVEDDLTTLLIEYAIEGMGSEKDLKKRHALENRMNETLGWTGLGNCDGGSIGSGTMEVCCYVVDFKIAKRVIADDLKKTKFADYSRIYDEGADSVASASGTKPVAQGPKILVAPWIMNQGLDHNDEAWQRGNPAEFLAQWIDWYQQMPVDLRPAYASLFPEPKGWTGFYKSMAKTAKR